MDRSTAARLTAHHRNRLRARYNLPISIQQRETQRDPGLLALPLWVCKVKFPAPADEVGRDSSSADADEGHVDLVGALRGVIERLGEGTERFDVPRVRDVEGEWVGWRRDGGNGNEVEVDERTKFKRLMRDTNNRLTILFVHGGAF